MIDRYTYPEMKAIWEPANRFAKWLEVELLVAEGLAEIGEVPKEAAAALRRAAKFDVARIEELEGEKPATNMAGKPAAEGKPALRHDLIAFLTAVSEHLGPERRYLHLGVTSYDIEDTALSLLLRESAQLLERDLTALMEAVRERAREHAHTLMIGRTHGVHAEPITFGLKLAVWLAELERDVERLRQARESVSALKISGAVGTYANIDPRVEQYVAGKLNLTPAKAATQVLQRDRHAHYISTLAIIGGTLEQFATEIRNLQRTDILEVEESFGAGQRGSSAMPHKRNPIISERITGLARLLRSYVVPALENMALWHERDLCHSSVERILLPDANLLLDYMLRKFTDIVRNLRVYPERMRANLDRLRGLVCSEQVMLALVRKGKDKDEAYRLVQARAMEAWEREADFRELVAADPEISAALSVKELAAVFDYERHLRHVDTILKRMGI